MQKVTTVSIGIPAYNEAKNIARLLTSLLAQKENGFVLHEIFVMSDGSTDDTSARVSSLGDKRIHFVSDKKRLGKSARLQQVMKLFTGDVLLLIDADVTIRDNELLSKVISLAHLNKTGLAGVNATPLEAQTKLESYLQTGVELMKTMAQSWRKGDNYLSFKGCFLALDKKFAKAISMPASVINNDAFFYFSAKKLGYTPVYLPTCFVYYRSPMHFGDHAKQAARFQTSRNEIIKYFHLDEKHEYTIPKQIIAISLLRTIMKKPVSTVGYLSLNIRARMTKTAPVNSTWSIAKSTK